MRTPRARPTLGWRAVATALAACALASAACGGGRPAKLIVYEAASGDATNIYTVDPVTAVTTQLTHIGTFAGEPAWSPDRKGIVLASTLDGQKENDIYVMDADGRNIRRLTDTPDGGEISPKYSRDAKLIAYGRQDGNRWALWLMNADGTDQRKIAGDYAFLEFPAWSPNAKEIYYSAIERDAATGDAYGSAKIYSVELSTQTVRVRIDTGTGDVCPHFSREGKRLTYAAGRDDNPSNLDIFASDIASADITGATDTPRTMDPARDDYANASPDDRTMVFISDRSGTPELYLMDRDGSHQRRLTNTPDLKKNVPDW